MSTEIRLHFSIQMIFNINLKFIPWKNLILCKEKINKTKIRCIAK